MTRTGAPRRRLRRLPHAPPLPPAIARPCCQMDRMPRRSALHALLPCTSRCAMLCGLMMQLALLRRQLGPILHTLPLSRSHVALRVSRDGVL